MKQENAAIDFVSSHQPVKSLNRSMDSIRNLVKQRLSQYGQANWIAGESAAYNWLEDPSRFVFSLTRYKFVSRMLSGFDDVLEVGCADGFGSYIVSKHVNRLTCIDLDESLIDSAKKTVGIYSNNIDFQAGNIQDESFLKDKTYDGIYALDVLEHIDQSNEDEFINKLCERLNRFGTMIIGMPSLESQAYASELSKIGHINCKTQEQLKALCCRHFRTCQMMGANDELINTGFPQLQHYRLAICSAPICHMQNK